MPCGVASPGASSTVATVLPWSASKRDGGTSGCGARWGLVRACRCEQAYLAGVLRTVGGRLGGARGAARVGAGLARTGVGGGPGFFAAAFGAAGARYTSVDLRPVGDVCGDARALPVRDGAVDVCFSSNVLEHVADPRRMLREMLRVTRGRAVWCSCASPTGWVRWAATRRHPGTTSAASGRHAGMSGCAVLPRPTATAPRSSRSQSGTCCDRSATPNRTARRTRLPSSRATTPRGLTRSCACRGCGSS